MRINKDLAYLLGAMRDGCLPHEQKNKEVVFASDWFRLWIDDVSQKVQKVFHLRPEKVRIYKEWTHKSQRPYFRLKVYSKEVYEKMKNFYPTGKQENWETPEIIKNSNLETQVEYIRGFYDAEGGCRDVEKFLRGKTKSMNCEVAIRCKHAKNPNEPLEFIKTVLNKFGINCYIPRDNTRLVITGKQNVLKFFINFKPLHKRKREMLKKLLEFYGVLTSAEV
jgi:intein/homing endonuclease